MENYLRVGVIANTHGIRGEVKVYPTTDNKERFQDLKTVALDTGTEYQTLTVQSARYFKNLVILKFKEFDSINEVEMYKGKDLLIRREDAVALEENEYFICDILGAAVETQEGESLGVVEEVLTTAANDVFVVRTKSGKELLLPVIDECVKVLDTEHKRVEVHLMPGLVES